MLVIKERATGIMNSMSDNNDRYNTGGREKTESKTSKEMERGSYGEAVRQAGEETDSEVIREGSTASSSETCNNDLTNRIARKRRRDSLSHNSNKRRKDEPPAVMQTWPTLHTQHKARIQNETLTQQTRQTQDLQAMYMALPRDAVSIRSPGSSIATTNITNRRKEPAVKREKTQSRSQNDLCNRLQNNTQASYDTSQGKSHDGLHDKLHNNLLKPRCKPENLQDNLHNKLQGKLYKLYRKQHKWHKAQHQWYRKRKGRSNHAMEDLQECFLDAQRSLGKINAEDPHEIGHETKHKMHHEDHDIAKCEIRYKIPTQDHQRSHNKIHNEDHAGSQTEVHNQTHSEIYRKARSKNHLEVMTNAHSQAKILSENGCAPYIEKTQRNDEDVHHATANSSRLIECRVSRDIGWDTGQGDDLENDKGYNLGRKQGSDQERGQSNYHGIKQDNGHERDNGSDQSSDPISDQSSDPISDQSSDPISDQSSDAISDQSSDAISDQSSDPISDQSSDAISDQSSDPGSDNGTDSIGNDDEILRYFENSSTSTTSSASSASSTLSYYRDGLSTPATSSSLTSLTSKHSQDRVRKHSHDHAQITKIGFNSMSKSFIYSDNFNRSSFSHRSNRLNHPNTPIYSLSTDMLALTLSFLEVDQAYAFVSMPFSKTWITMFIEPQELWKILCTSGPFYAKLGKANAVNGKSVGNVTSDSESEDATCSFPTFIDKRLCPTYGKFRLLYSYFVQCKVCLDRLARNAQRTLVSKDENYPFLRNGPLRKRKRKGSTSRNVSCRNSSNARSAASPVPRDSSNGSSFSVLASASPGTSSGASQYDSAKRPASTKRTKRRNVDHTTSKKTHSDESVSSSVDSSHQITSDCSSNQPSSCANYSVIHWMEAFPEVEGIQIMCLKVLPHLLEDEPQRIAAQQSNLSNNVLRAMVLFPNNMLLHASAFHTLVFLARPLGRNEGTLFRMTMVNATAIFGPNRSNGIAIMLDSMKRFSHVEEVQAMGCWSLVNVALVPLQKRMLVKLGGLTVTANAMLRHPYNEKVQFRALFALINLVIPCVTNSEETEESCRSERELYRQLGKELSQTSEKEVLDANVAHIINLVVLAMKNFCSSEHILNRACVVLHNISLNPEYHSVLLWTPNCYQMLEWCIGNYTEDRVLQQSAGGTIQRLVGTLNNDEELRSRFLRSIRTQQQQALEKARWEAASLGR